MTNLSKHSSIGTNTNAVNAYAIVRRVVMVVGIVLCVILVPILICNVILMVKGAANPNEVPSIFGIAPYYVMTDSMAPYFDGGDLIFIHKVAADDIAIDDVIAFFDPLSTEQEMVAHRVKDIFVDQQGNIDFVTQGDANNIVDIVTVPATNVVGKYVLRMRGMGRVAMFIQSTPGVIVCVSVPLLFLVGGELVNYLYKTKHQDATDTEQS